MSTLVAANSWGGGVGVRIPKAFRESLGIHAGDEIEMSLRGDEIVMRVPPASNSIEALLANWDKGRFSEPEIDWGSSVGNEVW